MADWVVCAHCQLRHSLRPDGRCPRCGNALPGVSPQAADAAA
jgi:uncharacterized paraquat-inducible protein A